MSNRLLRAYLVEGRSVRDIADGTVKDEMAVRQELADLGIRISSREIREVVCAAVAWRGYVSFSEFARQHGLEPLSVQAELLGVPQAALEKIHDRLRQLVQGSGS